MKTNPGNILIPIDFEKPSLIALEQSYNLARLQRHDIHLLYVHEEAGIFSRFFSAQQSDEILLKIKADLDALAQKTSEDAGVKVYARLEKGKPHDVILKIAKELDARLIFMGTTNADENIVGVTAHKVIRTASCPVITVKEDTYHDGCRTILLPLDLTSETRQKVGWCIEIAKVYQARIRILSVLWSKNDEIKQQLGIQLKQVKNFIEKSGVSCTAELLETGNSKETIIPVVLEYVNSHLEIDLVVIMTQSEIGIIDFFLDSDAQQIIRSSKVPVMSIVPRDIGMSSIRSF